MPESAIYDMQSIADQARPDLPSNAVGIVRSNIVWVVEDQHYCVDEDEQKSKLVESVRANVYRAPANWIVNCEKAQTLPAEPQPVWRPFSALEICCLSSCS